MSGGRRCGHRYAVCATPREGREKGKVTKEYDGKAYMLYAPTHGLSPVALRQRRHERSRNVTRPSFALPPFPMLPNGSSVCKACEGRCASCYLLLTARPPGTPSIAPYAPCFFKKPPLAPPTLSPIGDPCPVQLSSLVGACILLVLDYADHLVYSLVMHVRNCHCLSTASLS